MSKPDQKPEFIVSKLEHKTLAYVVVVFNANRASKGAGWLLSVPEMPFFDHGFNLANDPEKESFKKHAIDWSRIHLMTAFAILFRKASSTGV